MNERAQFEEEIACDLCGRFGAFAIGGGHVCENCYEAQGSCCLEFGGEDLWRVREQREDAERNAEGKRDVVQ